MRLQQYYHRHLLLVTLLLSHSHGQTISCPNGNSTFTAKLTNPDEQGPFYLPNSPKTSIIAPRQFLIDPTNVFVVQGQVIGNNCLPLTNAQIEAWYAGEGIGYHAARFRGQVPANNCGRFLFTQTFPAVSDPTDRPVPHIHYRITDSDTDTVLLVTQLFLEGDIPPGFIPDPTQIAKVQLQPDGSRMALFSIYVNVPGNADVNVCGTPTPVLVAIPNNNYYTVNATEADKEEELPVISNAMEVDDESLHNSGLLLPCGDVVCEPGLECCNESCGTCVPPGEPCRVVGCVAPVQVLLRGANNHKEAFDPFD